MASFGGSGSASSGNTKTNFNLGFTSPRPQNYYLAAPNSAAVQPNAIDFTDPSYKDPKLRPNPMLPPGPGNTGRDTRSTTASGSASGSAGGGGGAGTATNWSVQANPYLDQVFNRFNDLWGRYDELGKEAPNPEPAIQDYQRMRRQGWDEALAAAGRRGLTGGLSLAGAQNYLQGTEQGAQKIAADWGNTALNFKKDLLTGMAGALTGQTGAASSAQAGQLGLMSAANDALARQQNYDYLMNVQAPLQLMQAQLSAATQLAGLV